MSGFVGLDVSVETAAVCVIDDAGGIVRELSVASDPDVLATSVEPFASDIQAIGLEAGPMSSFLAAGLERHGLSAILMERRRVSAALSAVPVKTDRGDARGIAELLRTGWVQPVHLKSAPARDIRLMLSARETLGRRIRELDNSVRGLLRGFGLRVPKGARGRFSGLVRALVTDNPVLGEAITPLSNAREAMAVEFARLDRLVRELSARDDVCARLMTVPGVGAVIALTFRAAIDDPTRFRSSKSVGACFGLTPRRYQSGETDRVTSITKAGDPGVRAALYEAAQVMLVRSTKWTRLKSWAMRIAARRGAKRAKIALARKLAVVMHRMWIDGTDFRTA